MLKQINLYIKNSNMSLIIFLLTFTIRLFFISQTVDFYDVDEFVNLSQGKYLAMGWTPYIDFISNHPPGITLLLSLPHLFSPQCWLAMRIFTAFIDSITSVLLYKIALNILGDKAASITALLYVFNPITIRTSTLVMQEPYVLFFVIAAIYLLNNRNPRLVISSLLIAFSVFIKYISIMFLPVYFLIVRKEDRIKLSILIFAFTFLLFTPFTPEISEMINQTILFQIDRESKTLSLKVLDILVFGIIPLPFAILSFGKIKKEHTWIYAGYLSMLSFLLFPVIYYHYFLLITPFACLLSAKPLLYLGKTLFKYLNPPQSHTKLSPSLRDGLLLITLLICFSSFLYSFSVFLLNPEYIGDHKLSDITERLLVIEFIENNTKACDLILADYPEYAYLSNRINLFGYFWNAKYSLNRNDFFSNLRKVKMVVSTKKCRYSNTSKQIYSCNYPPDFILYLDKNYHKLYLNKTTIYLTTRKMGAEDETKT